MLLPTVSKISRTNHAEIRDYFIHFLEKKPVGEIITSEISIDCLTAKNVGKYEFSFHDKNEKKTSEVEARFSYTYRYKDGRWLITSHHSSVSPAN